MSHFYTKPPLVIYFTKDTVPSGDEMREMGLLVPAQVVMRNARYVAAGGSLERCDGVAGVVPDSYRDAYPTAETAIDAFNQKREEAAQDEGGEGAEIAALDAGKPTITDDPSPQKSAPKQPAKKADWKPN